MFRKKRLIVFILLFCLLINNLSVIALDLKYPDYGYEFLGNDKWENFNRKIFNFNLKLNKYAIRPIHILWASIMPKYGMDRIHGITNNIEYPIRLFSSLIQKDFINAKNESIRFITNTTIGLGGMFDPAKHLFKLEQSSENMDQALAGCKLKTGPYFVLPVLSFSHLRGTFGKILDMAFNPTTYIATPVLAAVKAGLTINRTSYIQPLIKMVESTYADPYDIAKKAFGIDSYIKCANLDRVDVLSSLNVPYSQDAQNTEEKSVQSTKTPMQDISKKENIVNIEVSSELILPNLLYGGTNLDQTLGQDYGIENFELDPDIKLYGFNPQNPVVDSMRTALFALPGVDESIWNELSIWNRCFNRRIKTSAVNITEGKDNYKYRYILQNKKKNSPLAIIYPSIGEGIMSSHSVLLAKLFYDAGYSVIIQGSHFQWEFVKSMPNGYYPGLPSKDADILRLITAKIINQLSKKYEYNFSDKVFVGTSFGALASLFVASKEYQNNTLGNTKYIAICPPINLIYAMKQIDKNSEEWNTSSQDLKQRVASTAAKVVKLYQSKKDINIEINNLPFTEEEGKLITGFIMHQKLSDLIFTLENTPKNKSCEIYKTINNMNYQDYVKKYLLANNEDNCDDLSYETSLASITNYLNSADNYKIYHSVNDYLTNNNQIKNLKKLTGDKTILLDNGSHLGFIYRKEFIESLKNTIAMMK